MNPFAFIFTGAKFWPPYTHELHKHLIHACGITPHENDTVLNPAFITMIYQIV